MQRKIMKTLEIKVDKPWGYEIIWAHTDRYVGKTLHINKNHRLSLQYHKNKTESIRVLSGFLLLEVNNETILMSPGTNYDIAPGVIHRMCAKDGDVDVLEVSTPELDDVVRLQDDYMRVPEDLNK